MTAKIIDGKVISEEIKQEVAEEVKKLQAEKGITPGLAVILVGEDPASQSYVKSKEKTSVKLGMHSEVYRLPESTSQTELLGLIDRLNGDPKIHGLLVQLPLPKHIDEGAVVLAIRPEKDVDGFHPINVGNLHTGERALIPCTPHGVIVLLDKMGLEIKGKHAVVVGRSNIVGKPAAMLLLSRNATVTICHSRTPDLAAFTRQADILVAAVGKPEMIRGDMVKPGAVVIDVGVNRVDGKLVGDVDFAGASEVASYITPVPGGVGPMTIAMLMKNTLEAAKNNI